MSTRNREVPGRVSSQRKLWQLLSSPRLALVLILALGALCLVGALLLQVPSEVAANPESYRLWVQNIAKPRLGVWADIFSFLKLFDVFHSPWFLAAGGMLMINILFCTINRWNSINIMVRGGKLEQAREFIGKGTARKELLVAGLPDKASPLVGDILKKHHYRVRTQGSGGAIHMAADKNRFSTLGTFLTHLSLIILVLGFFITSFWGFRDAFFIVPEGSIRDVGHDTALSLELKSFEDDYWVDGSPKDYRSQVVLYAGKQEVREALVRVNSPLSYRGINFYQSTFGPAVKMQVNASGQLLYDECVPLSQVLGDARLQRPAGVFDLPQVGLAVGLLGPALSGLDPIIGEEELGIVFYRMGEEEPVKIGVLEMGVPSEFEGMEFNFTSEAQYSGFQVTRSPGTTLIWIASCLFVVGLGLVFYFPLRQMWVLIERGEGDNSRLIVRATGRSSPGDDELSAVIQEMKESCQR